MVKIPCQLVRDELLLFAGVSLSYQALVVACPGCLVWALPKVGSEGRRKGPKAGKDVKGRITPFPSQSLSSGVL